MSGLVSDEEKVDVRIGGWRAVVQWKYFTDVVADVEGVGLPDGCAAAELHGIGCCGVCRDAKSGLARKCEEARHGATIWLVWRKETVGDSG